MIAFHYGLFTAAVEKRDSFGENKIFTLFECLWKDKLSVYEGQRFEKILNNIFEK